MFLDRGGAASGLGEVKMSDEGASWRRQENWRSRVQVGRLALNRDTASSGAALGEAG